MVKPAFAYRRCHALSCRLHSLSRERRARKKVRSGKARHFGMTKARTFAQNHEPGLAGRELDVPAASFLAVPNISYRYVLYLATAMESVVITTRVEATGIWCVKKFISDRPQFRCRWDLKGISLFASNAKQEEEKKTSTSKVRFLFEMYNTGSSSRVLKNNS